MAKTRAQTEKIEIKKEEVEDCKPSRLLHSVKNTAGNSSKITKRKPSKNKNRRLPDQDFKVEEDTDIKSLLKSTSNSLKVPKRRSVSQEQINQLIDYVANHGMSVSQASRKVNINRCTGYNYYKIYKNDPDKKIPSPRNQLLHPKRCYTQEQVENLIKYINDGKMSLAEASAKADMTHKSGQHYYSTYLKDPNHSIPIPQSFQYYTQDQQDEFIGFIVNDKMSIAAASEKAKMSVGTGRKYYYKYFKGQNPTPSHIATYKRYTQNQIEELISYIIDDKMSIAAASRKVKMDQSLAGVYYRRYLKDHNMELPVSKRRKRYTQHQINKVVGYIVDDKMTINAASKKANMTCKTGGKYYQKYLKKHNLDIPVRKYTQDKITELIGYIIDDKMNIMAASKKANMCYETSRKYYRQYLKDNKHDAAT